MAAARSRAHSTCGMIKSVAGCTVCSVYNSSWPEIRHLLSRGNSAGSASTSGTRTITLLTSRIVYVRTQKGRWERRNEGDDEVHTSFFLFRDRQADSRFLIILCCRFTTFTCGQAHACTGTAHTQHWAAGNVRHQTWNAVICQSQFSRVLPLPLFLYHPALFIFQYLHPALFRLPDQKTYPFWHKSRR